MKTKIYLTAGVLLFAFLSGVVNGQQVTINSNDSGIPDAGGFYYTHWSATDGQSDNDVTFTLFGNRRFRYEWTNINNFVGGRGWQTGNKNRAIGYNAGQFDVNGTGNAYLGVYGWTESRLVEYYVIDSWNGDRPPVSGENTQSWGTFEIPSEGTYEVFSDIRTKKPSIAGDSTTFVQFWSVRTEKRPQGFNHSIHFGSHVEAWRQVGLRLGSAMDYQVMGVEGFNSTGQADVTPWSYGNPGIRSNTNFSGLDTSGGGAKTIIVRARSRGGNGPGAQIRLEINNDVKKTWDLDNTYHNYLWVGKGSGGSLIRYLNDTNGKDVQVAYIRVNSEPVRRGSDQTVNTALCGGTGQSDMMYCNGYIGFGNVQ